MDIFFTDPSDIPLPPAEVRIRQFTAEAYPDGRRVRVYLELTPFQKRPSGEVILQDQQGGILASASIIETMDPKMELTLHLRGQAPTGEYQALARIFYTAELAEEGSEDEIVQRPEAKLVDHAETTFSLA